MIHDTQVSNMKHHIYYFKTTNIFALKAQAFLL